jgi:hypothetical protein
VEHSSNGQSRHAAVPMRRRRWCRTQTHRPVVPPPPMLSPPLHLGRGKRGQERGSHAPGDLSRARYPCSTDHMAVPLCGEPPKPRCAHPCTASAHRRCSGSGSGRTACPARLWRGPASTSTSPFHRPGGPAAAAATPRGHPPPRRPAAWRRQRPMRMSGTGGGVRVRNMQAVRGQGTGGHTSWRMGRTCCVAMTAPMPHRHLLVFSSRRLA